MTTGVRVEPASASSPKAALPGAVSLPAMSIRRRRRPWLIAVGLLLASVGTLLVVWLVGAAGSRVEVLVLRADIPYGQAIKSSDLAIARISMDPGIAVVPASDRGALVGQFPAIPLAAGMLLSRSMVVPNLGPAVGKSLVPLAIAAERMPAMGLRPGDEILAVDAQGAANSGASEIGSGFRSTSALVVRVGPADINGVTVVDVVVTSGAAPDLAVASALGQVAIVLQSGGR